MASQRDLLTLLQLLHHTAMLIEHYRDRHHHFRTWWHRGEAFCDGCWGFDRSQPDTRHLCHFSSNGDQSGVNHHFQCHSDQPPIIPVFDHRFGQASTNSDQTAVQSVAQTNSPSYNTFVSVSGLPVQSVTVQAPQTTGTTTLTQTSSSTISFSSRASRVLPFYLF